MPRIQYDVLLHLPLLFQAKGSEPLGTFPKLITQLRWSELPFGPDFGNWSGRFERQQFDGLFNSPLGYIDPLEELGY